MAYSYQATKLPTAKKITKTWGLTTRQEKTNQRRPTAHLWYRGTYSIGPRGALCAMLLHQRAALLSARGARAAEFDNLQDPSFLHEPTDLHRINVHHSRVPKGARRPGEPRTREWEQEADGRAGYRDVQKRCPWRPAGLEWPTLAPRGEPGGAVSVARVRRAARRWTAAGGRSRPEVLGGASPSGLVLGRLEVFAREARPVREALPMPLHKVVERLRSLSLVQFSARPEREQQLVLCAPEAADHLRTTDPRASVRLRDAGYGRPHVLGMWCCCCTRQRMLAAAPGSGTHHAERVVKRRYAPGVGLLQQDARSHKPLHVVRIAHEHDASVNGGCLRSPRLYQRLGRVVSCRNRSRGR